MIRRHTKMFNIMLWEAVLVAVFINFAHCDKLKNVLVIVGDDAGFETQVYNNTVCQTPHLDGLARHSMVFTNAFTSVSSCSPSRSAILTGLPQHQNGMYGLHNGLHHFQSFDKVQSLPRILKNHGMRTGIVGKKHVAPDTAYPFDFSATENEYPILQAGRNISFMKEKVKEFLEGDDERPFLLYIGFHDPHRCGHTDPQYGQFCEKFGDGTPGMGVIQDWTPVHYSPDEVVVPYFVQDTPAARGDLAAQYTTISRMDQGIGLFLRELAGAGHTNDTMIIYTSDNGIPFPMGRTNLFEPGMREPFLLSSPHHKQSWGKENSALVTLLDIVPTVLDWLDIKYPKYSLFKKAIVNLTGQSLLPELEDPFTWGRTSPRKFRNKAGVTSGNPKREQANSLDMSSRTAIFASHNLHEITMYYPMRVIRTDRYKLIKNINYLMPFPIDQDFYISPTFQDLLNRTLKQQPLHWIKTLKEYYYRDAWELYDLEADPKEMVNVVGKPEYEQVAQHLLELLEQWQKDTSDPWLCSPTAVLEDSGAYKTHPKCMTMDNGLQLKPAKSEL